MAATARGAPVVNLTPFEVLALLLTATSGVGWVNRRFFGLPSSVGLLAMGLVAASALFEADRVWPGHTVAGGMAQLVQHFDFSAVLMGFLLAYLLFAGALNTDATELARFPVSIGLLSTVGVLVSTGVVAAGLWAVARLVGADLPFAWAVVFGALISPTDPVAVLAAFKGDDDSGKVRSLMEGEALFNDGVGVVVFGGALSLAVGGGAAPGPLAGRLLLEVAGGGLLGAAGAGGVLLLMRTIDDYGVEAGLSLALATGAYALAGRLHVSGPIAVVVAGLIVGTAGARMAMSARTWRYVRGFWDLVDDNLNAILFFLIGLEVVVAFRSRGPELVVCAAAVLLVSAARVVAVGPTLVRLVRSRELTPRQAPVAVWGGLRGGISVALALAVPPSPHRGLILACTCAVVTFSVLVRERQAGAQAEPQAEEQHIPHQRQQQDQHRAGVDHPAPRPARRPPAVQLLQDVGRRRGLDGGAHRAGGGVDGEVGGPPRALQPISAWPSSSEPYL